MNLTATLLLSLAGVIPVEATTLDGKSATGELSALTTRSVTVDVAGESRSLPVAELHELRLHKPSVARPSAREIRLHDGSRIGIDELQLTSRTAAVTSAVFGSVEVPRPSVHSLRLGKIDSKVEAAWNDLLQRQTRDDLVVVRKGDALDHVAGVISGIDEKAVQLLLDGSPVPVPRERVFGVILAASASSRSPTLLGNLETVNGDRLAIAAISLTNEEFTVETAAGPSARIPAGQVARIDFSLGKISYLVDLQPTQVAYPTEHELFLLDVWKYRAGTNSQNDPLRVGHQDYPRGLWIHSGTTLTWRLNREYRHLRGVAGIAAGISESCDPTVGLVIRGDGRVLLDVPVSRSDDVRDLDVDVGGVRELQIEVTSSHPEGICEHLGLGDVRVIK
jgi:hypothetical protein